MSSIKSKLRYVFIVLNNNESINDSANRPFVNNLFAERYVIKLKGYHDGCNKRVLILFFLYAAVSKKYLGDPILMDRTGRVEWTLK